MAIEGAPEVMEEVRAAVTHGYFSLARGGLEVGGLLFGRRDGGTLRIEGSRPILCQHAYGPAFTLSDSDLAGLAQLLEESSRDPELRGLEPVGWYLSHARSGLELSDRDLEVHNRWFPEAWQVALVLRPERTTPTRAAFYVRDAQGPPRQLPEFVVEPRAGLRQTILATPAVPHVEPRQEAPAPPEQAAAPPAPVAAEGPPPAFELPIPSFLQGPAPAPGPGRRWWLLFSLAWSVAAGSSAFALRDYWLPKPPAALQVALQDAGGQLAIQWNQEAPAIREAEGGVLEIQDGDRKRVLKMSAQDLRGASVVVGRQSGRVTVRLEAKLPRGRTAEGRALFEGEPVQNEVAIEKDRLAAELERLQKDFSSQKQRNLELEAVVAALRKRLAAKP